MIQPLPIQKWKWKTISMDFITGLPNSTKTNDAIMVVVDNLSKDAHLILINSTCKETYISNIFMKEIFRLHRIPRKIISDKDTKFAL
jgi:hypothetical protein